jgi:aarF domain-containing kinase
VKVQHEGLREGSRGDLIAITFLVEQLSKLFEGFSYNWLSREMNLNLPLELDFTVEASNCNKCKDFLKDMIDSGDVALPEIHRSSKRAIVMSFEEGSFVTADGELQRMGLKEGDVARTISRTFCEQIYRHGFVHCDPHEANMLIRKHPTRAGAPQIVLLDHGLYKELPPDFRKQYCRLWRGLVTSNEAEIKRNCELMNAGAIYTLLAAMLTMKPWDDVVSDDIGRLKSKGTRGESEMLKSYAKKYFKEIVGLLGDVPPEMLLLLKTNDCLRHLDTALGVPINTATIVAEITSGVIFSEDIRDADYQTKLNALRDYVGVLVRVVALKTIDLWLRCQRFLSLRTFMNWFGWEEVIGAVGAV